MTEFSPPYSVTPSGFKIPLTFKQGFRFAPPPACILSHLRRSWRDSLDFPLQYAARRVPTLQKGGRPRAGGRGMHRGRPGEGGGGAGGSRTHVRTRKPHAFYTLIPDFIFERRQDLDHQPAPYPLKFHQDGEAHPDYFRFSCAAGSSDSEQHPWGDVSFPHLVKELS